MGKQPILLIYFFVTLLPSIIYIFLTVNRPEKYFDVEYLAMNGKRYRSVVSAERLPAFISRVFFTLALLGFFSIGYAGSVALLQGLIGSESISYIATICGFGTLYIPFVLHKHACMLMVLKNDQPHSGN
jgi:hypothetical protein